MGVVRFCIVFDKPNKVYYPGEIVTGRVELVLNSKIKIRGVELKLKGRATSSWSEPGFPVRHYFYSFEICLNRKQFLIGGRDNFKLSEGEHTYPFAIKLPDKMPTSFNGRYGKISYHGEAKIYIPFGFNTKKRIGFTVIRPLKLDLFPNLKTPPYGNEKIETFYCLWSTSGPVTVVFRLPKTTFAVTESIIPMMMEVDNESNLPVNAIHVVLKRKICWKANECEKKESFILQILRLDGVEPGESRKWSENFEIPSISFPNLDGCEIIKINHKLRIETVTSSSDSHLHFHIPVTIVDVLVPNHSKTWKVTPQMQTIPDIFGDPGIRMPAKGVPLSYPNHNPQRGNDLCLENSDDAPFEQPSLQIYPLSDPDHIVSHASYI